MIDKGPTRAEEKQQRDAAEAAEAKANRLQVLGREKGECRCCREFFDRLRAAQSVHEIRFRSLGGKRTTENSIAVCGSGTTGCHGMLQQLKILVDKLTPAGADGPLRFKWGTQGPIRRWAA